MIALPADNDPIRQRLNASADLLRSHLACNGTLHEATVRTDCGDVTLSTASDSGSKESNQDFSALFIPQHDSQQSSQLPLQWAAAVADGVSDSTHSEFASAIACYAALLAVRLSYTKQSKPMPVTFSSRLLHIQGRAVEKNPADYKPPGMTNSTWKRVLRDGRFAQTTLMVAWEDDRGLQVEGIGDGGMALRFDDDSAAVSYLPTSDKPVRCLGPKGHFAEPDYRYHFRHWKSLSLFTDGVTPLIESESEQVEKRLLSESRQPSANPASEVLRGMSRFHEELIQDNLTLFSAIRRTP